MSDKTDSADHGSSAGVDPPLVVQSRRDLLKKGVYVTPTLMVLGALISLNDATAQSTCNGFPCEPDDGQPLRNPSPRKPSG
jgi:hypothetical protein